MDQVILEISDLGNMSGFDFSIFHKILGFEKSQILVSLANLSHIWEGRSQTVSMEEPDLIMFHAKLLSCYDSGRLKTMFFDLDPKGSKSQISRRRRTNSQIQIQAPPNSPRDEILPQGKPSLLIISKTIMRKLLLYIAKISKYLNHPTLARTCC